jgi:thymidine kinase
MAKLYFYYSAMNAGKTTTLLQSSYNYQERGMQTVLLTPKIDTRYGVGKVASRIGLEADAVAMDADFDIYAYVLQQKQRQPKLACVLVDEAHFLNKTQVLALAVIVDTLKIPVLAYGLRSDFQAKTFEGSEYLLALADELIEIKTICHCGKKASMNMRVDADGKMIKQGAQIQIGGNESYVSVCRSHFFQALREGEQQV